MWVYTFKNRAVSCGVISVHVHFTAAMLVYFDVQYSMSESTFTITMKKFRQLAVHCLRIIIQITACPTYGNNGQMVTCMFHSDGESAVRSSSIVHQYGHCKTDDGKLMVTCMFHSDGESAVRSSSIVHQYGHCKWTCTEIDIT